VRGRVARYPHLADGSASGIRHQAHRHRRVRRVRHVRYDGGQRCPRHRAIASRDPAVRTIACAPAVRPRLGARAVGSRGGWRVVGQGTRQGAETCPPTLTYPIIYFIFSDMRDGGGDGTGTSTSAGGTREWA